MVFPTANISIAEPYKLEPAKGIYAVMVTLEGMIHKGMLYIGNRPVFNGKRLSVEVNIFDFNESIYNRHISVMIKDRIRDDMPFTNREELIKAMGEDKKTAAKVLRNE